MVLLQECTVAKNQAVVPLLEGGGRDRLLGFIWQTWNDEQNWIRKPKMLRVMRVP